MTFSDTHYCVFCGKPRFVDEKEQWETLLMVFYEHGQGNTHRSGWVVTACRECREVKTVAELMVAAKEVY